MDFRQPLLLYREHQVSRLYARNVTSAGSSKKEVGPYIVLPHNYQGEAAPLLLPPLILVYHDGRYCITIF